MRSQFSLTAQYQTRQIGSDELVGLPPSRAGGLAEDPATGVMRCDGTAGQ